jgi:hypothetical protein
MPPHSAGGDRSGARGGPHLRGNRRCPLGSLIELVSAAKGYRYTNHAAVLSMQASTSFGRSPVTEPRNAADARTGILQRTSIATA